MEGPDEGMHGRDAAMEAKKAFDKGSPDDLGNTDARGDIPLLDNLLEGMLEDEHDGLLGREAGFTCGEGRNWRGFGVGLRFSLCTTRFC